MCQSLMPAHNRQPTVSFDNMSNLKQEDRCRLSHSLAYSRLHLACFARARHAIRTHDNFRKKGVSLSTQNALKRIEMQKKSFYPFDRLRTLRVAQSPSDVAQ